MAISYACMQIFRSGHEDENVNGIEEGRTHDVEYGDFARVCGGGHNKMCM